MLWLCITLPQLPLEALQCERSEQPTVVTSLEGNVRSIVCCNPAADRVGLKPGLNFTTALSMLPEVIALERRVSAEQSALERLATWAYQFSGTVIVGETFGDLQRACSTALWLGIGASLVRLTARLGEDHVHGLKAVADHRPESTWAQVTGMASIETVRSRLDFPDRPLWLLPEPKPLQSGTVPPLAPGAERIESGWWDGGDVQRDYFIARTPQGAALWIYRDASDGSWHLHGFWS